VIEERRPMRRPQRPGGAVLGAALLTGAACAALVLPGARAPASTPISGADAEGLLALRYPKLRESRDAVIACPRGPIEPGDEAQCWILARVGQQRAVMVRLSPRGNRVEVDD
jgi:hypothetical protein